MGFKKWNGNISVKCLCRKSDWAIWKYRIKFILNYLMDALKVIKGRIRKTEEPNPADAKMGKKSTKTI